MHGTDLPPGTSPNGHRSPPDETIGQPEQHSSPGPGAAEDERPQEDECGAGTGGPGDPGAEGVSGMYARLREEEHQELVRIALGKFNVFLHLTAWLSGCGYLVILGVLMPKFLPYVLIPIALWTAGLVYHAYRSFRKPR